MAVPSVFGMLAYYFIMFIITVLVISLIVTLLGSIKCTSFVPNVFEHFDDALDAQMDAVTDKIGEGLEDIQKGFESLDDIGSKICAVMDTIEAGYVNEKTMLSEAEQELPSDKQEKLTEKRNQRAIRDFAAKKKGAGPIIECFASMSGSEEELNEKIESWYTMSKSDEFKEYVKKLNGILVAIGFNNPFLAEALKEVAAATAAAAAEEPVEEGFATKREKPRKPQQGQALLQEGNNVAQQISSYLQMINSATVISEQQQEAVEIMNQKTKEATDPATAQDAYSKNDGKSSKKSTFKVESMFGSKSKGFF